MSGPLVYAQQMGYAAAGSRDCARVGGKFSRWSFAEPLFACIGAARLCDVARSACLTEVRPPFCGHQEPPTYANVIKLRTISK